MGIRLADLIRRPVLPKLRISRTSEGGSDRKPDGYSRALQAARVRAAHQRSYFAPALFNLVPVETTLVGSMAVDSQWRLYYNEAWLAAHSVEQNASLLVHEVSHLLRDHEGRKKAAGIRDHRRWNTAGDCEINDDLQAEGLPLPGDPPLPAKYGLRNGERAETYYHHLPAPPRGDDQGAIGEGQDCGSGAHGERRFWELPADDGSEGGVPGVDRIKAELVRRDVAHRIEATSIYDTDVPLAWRRWARATLAPKVDYMATLRHTVRRALRQSTLGRYDRTYRRPHRRQACYGEFIMASFHQPRPRAGFLIDTSGSMGDSQLARAVSELGGLTRQIGYGAEVIVACCDAAVHDVRKAFTGTPIELYGGGGTDMSVGLRAFIERRNPPIDLLVIVSDCLSPWPADVPPFPVITVRVGEGAPPPWGNRGANRVITIEDAATTMEPDIRKRQT
ncbi:MAG TPA: VWA-like domain-containing protein [Vicinamibacterales bacterium]|nr:VWA-like domain-containing protein [Vicinamibacterales bacterium]